MVGSVVGIAQAAQDIMGLAPIVNGFSGSILTLAGAVVVGAIAFQGIVLAVRHRLEHVVETIVVIGVAVALILGATRIGALAGTAAGASLLPNAMATVSLFEEWVMLAAYVVPGWGLCRWWQGRTRRG
jgi:TRAP-type uncharacterized transport system fused permease subunit